jgi:hypothetical protein
VERLLDRLIGMDYLMLSVSLFVICMATGQGVNKDIADYLYSLFTQIFPGGPLCINSQGLACFLVTVQLSLSFFLLRYMIKKINNLNEKIMILNINVKLPILFIFNLASTIPFTSTMLILIK